MNSFNKLLILFLAFCSLSIASCEEEPVGPSGNNLDDLAGSWVRVLSNNPGNDGMELSVTGNTGTITVARNNFVVGSVKWKDITPSDIRDFEYQELGSDNSYYTASMDLDIDTVYLSVGSSGAGNTQKWVRKSKYTEPEPSEEAITLECNSGSTSTVLINGPGPVDYIVPTGCVLDITSSWQIESGTVIVMEENSGIGVYDNGSFKAIGTSAEPIVIKGAQNLQGYWRGIHIESISVDNQLDYVKIQDAGSNYVYCCNEAASVLLKGARISIKNTEISNGFGLGLWVMDGTELREYAGNTITTHKEYPLGITPEGADQLDGLGSSYAGNEKDFAFLINKDLKNPSTFRKLNIPYLTDAQVYDITEKLSVEAGAEIVFAENGGLGIYDNGALTIAGTESQPVIFRGQQSVAGYWRGIHIETNSLSNDINYLQLSHAGSNYVYCCNGIGSIFLKDGRASIKNTTISVGAGYGIHTKVGFSFSEFQNNRITTHAQEALYLSMEQAGQLDGMGSDFSGNSKDYVRIYSAQVKAATHLAKSSVPYSIETGKIIDVVEALTLDPGVDLVFETQAGLGIYDAGSLNAVGTSSEKVIFRGKSEQKGFWRGIHTETNSINNVLDFVEIRNAGSNYVYCCNTPAALFVKGGKMTLSNSRVADNDGCGVVVKTAATLTETNNTYANNTEGNVCN